MSSAIEKILIVIELLESITGIWGNGFIVLVNCADCIKTKKISLLDFIFTCLAISRIIMIGIILEDSLRIVYYPEISEKDLIIMVVIDFFWNLSNSLSTWCATCLSVFYFLKLSNFSHPFFLWLKWRRHRVVVTILLGFFLSLFCNLLSLKFETFWVSDNLEMERNSTWKECRCKNQHSRNQFLLNLVSLIPVVMSLISFFMLIFSLWRHTRQMTHHAKGSGDLHTEIHVRARNTMISFIILLVVHYLSTLLIWFYYTPENSISVITTETVMLLYPSVHPVNMILGNRKLRQTSVNLLRQIESCLKARSSFTAWRN